MLDPRVRPATLVGFAVQAPPVWCPSCWSESRVVSDESEPKSCLPLSGRGWGDTSTNGDLYPVFR